MNKISSLNKDIQVHTVDTIQNEEDLRYKLLNPYLKSIGFNASDISIEKNFTITLGTNKIDVSSSKKSGRLDLLCKKNNQNLFVIELKKDTHEVNQSDIDQGISYARLLDNIAPFTIITNGKEVHIYDTITKKRLNNNEFSDESKFWRNGCKLSGKDLEIRYEALKNFVSFSEDNLKVFCETQIKDRMSNLRNDYTGNHYKFIEELHTKREELHKSFENFINSEYSFFAIYGKSGVGKTCSVCSLVLNTLEDQFVLFFNGALQKDPPIEAICRDLNIFFSESVNRTTALQKLNDLANAVNKKIIVFIDAIDESSCQDINLEISETAREVSKYQNIKFCISSKVNTWDYFIDVKGIPSHLYKEVYYPKNKNQKTEKSLPGFQLHEFSDEELEVIFSAYKKYFNFNSELTNSLKGNLRNGFLLRVFSELYQNSEAPNSVNNETLIYKYLESILEKIEINNTSAFRVLTEIGRAFIESPSSSQLRQSIRIDEVFDKLGLSINESLPSDFFSRNILVKSTFNKKTYLSFYFTKIRDYIISYHSYELQNKDPEDFEEIVKKLTESRIGYSALYFYASNCRNPQHKQYLNKYQELKYLEFTKSYQKYLDTHFYKIKRLFNPYTQGDIGIVISKSENDLVESFAFFPIDEPNSETIIEKNLSFQDLHKLNSTFSEFNISTIHHGNRALTNDNIEHKTKNLIFDQLEDIISAKKLDHSENNILLLEKAVNIIYFNAQELGIEADLNDKWYPLYEKIYPLDFKELYDLTKQKRKFKQLALILKQLLNNNIKYLSKHYLSAPDIPVDQINSIIDEENRNNISHQVSSQFSTSATKTYLKAFFQKLENSYEKLVEDNFPTLKKDFLFYSTMPHKYIFHQKNSYIEKITAFTIGESATSNINFHFINNSIQYRQEFDDLIYTLGARLSSFLRNYHNAYKIGNNRNISHYNTLEYWAYRFIQNDLEKYAKDNDLEFR